MRKRRRPRPQPDRALTLKPITLDCPECQHRTRADYNNFRTITTLEGVLRLTLAIRRCPNPECPRFLRPYRPEAESHLALPSPEFGLAVMAAVARLRYPDHRSIPRTHRRAPPGPAGAQRRRGLRRPGEHPQGGGAGPPRGPPPALPFPLPPRGGPADL